MLEGLAGDTRVIVYLMAGIGVLGILAKIINQLTLYRLVRAAGNMPKSTHRLIKLVRAKYEHACMIHDSVENIDAFVEKYIYEYRGFLFRIHTWRQIEILSVWFAGILAALGASVNYLSLGLTETVYQYIAAGIAEMVLLSVIMRLSDEPYKINAVKMYMVDYLENICAIRLRKQTQRERESIDVIAAESGGKGSGQTVSHASGQEAGFRKKARAGRGVQTNTRQIFTQMYRRVIQIPGKMSSRECRRLDRLLYVLTQERIRQRQLCRGPVRNSFLSILRASPERLREERLPGRRFEARLRTVRTATEPR